MQPTFVERLDAWELMDSMGMALPPIMIHGDDVSHIVTEEGIANLLLCRTAEEREQAIRGVAGYTPVGLARDRRMVENLRDRGVIRRPEDLGIHKRDATRDLLAARSVKDLVRWSGGLYDPPQAIQELVALRNSIDSGDEGGDMEQLQFEFKGKKATRARRSMLSPASFPRAISRS